MANQIFNQPSDFTANPVTIPKGQLLQIFDVNGNMVAHRDISRPFDQTDNNGYYANQFADATAYNYPLSLTFTADPNYVPLPASDTSF